MKHRLYSYWKGQEYSLAFFESPSPEETSFLQECDADSGPDSIFEVETEDKDSAWKHATDFLEIEVPRLLDEQLKTWVGRVYLPEEVATKDKVRLVLQPILEVLQKYGCTYRIWFPGTIGIKDLRMERCNFHFKPRHGKYVIDSIRFG